MTDQPTTEAGRALRDAIATYGASTPSGTTAPHVLVGMRFMWGLGAIIDPAILAIEAEAHNLAEQAKGVPSVERIAEALHGMAPLTHWAGRGMGALMCHSGAGHLEAAAALRAALLASPVAPEEEK